MAEGRDGEAGERTEEDKYARADNHLVKRSPSVSLLRDCASFFRDIYHDEMRGGLRAPRGPSRAEPSRAEPSLAGLTRV